jgi:hypothetical protein
MALSRVQKSAWAPWAALVAAALATTVNQQVLSDMLRYDCRLGTPWTGVFVGTLDLAVIALGCWVSWASIRGSADDGSHQATRRFIARLGLLFAALLSVAVLWQVLATFMVPPCPD